ncbi:MULTISPECIES: rod shape-determining protein MreD [Enterococcus]|uniref:rod shape-determining protein MreD n=1 Tax=Enterococcus TaxID=1350 RepID=UPI00065E2334|nr:MULTISPECIES: rod shape-determining protein MreD [Enterococcus]KAF1304486.1 rod shape-determining protein MreD [Enterococcus sp. JM9B]
MRKEYVKYYAVPFFFFMMLLDGQATRLLEIWTKDVYMAKFHFLILALMCGCRVLSKRFMLITALILGILYDFYYIGVLGIYAVALPILVWLMFTMAKTLYRNLFTMFFGLIIFVTGYELATLGIQLLFKLTSVNGMFFVTRFLGPTLLINMILFVLCIYPFKKLFAVE